MIRRVVSSNRVSSSTSVSAGGEFTSATATSKVAVALIAGTPLSVTVTVKVWGWPPSASPGVQVITPRLELIAAPAGDCVSS